ncbi:MAG: protein kinase [Myxococcales bacterium]|nr:protein kinase [Myxococcales bacterium]
MDLAPGARVDRYVVEQLLGRGGMASVWRVRHETLNAPFALKVLELSQRSVKARLLEEGRIQAGLRHPNIVSVVDSVDVDGQPGLVMEYVDGPTLEEVLRGGRLSSDQIEAVATDILSGLAAAHAQGLVHRDLKPGNVLIARNADGGRTAKIADFGLAKLLDPGRSDMSRTRTGQVMGTPLFMAPEQFKDAKDLDARADVWAMGVMLYELVTGRRPYDGDDMVDILDALRRVDWPTPRQLDRTVPERWDRAVTESLVLDRAGRPVDGAALLALWRGEQVSAPVWKEEVRGLPKSFPDLRSAPTSGATLTPSFLEAPPVLTPPARPAPETMPEPPAALAVTPAAVTPPREVRQLLWTGSALAIVGVLLLIVWAGARFAGYEPAPIVGTLELTGEPTEIRVLTDRGTYGAGPIPVGTWPYEERDDDGTWVRSVWNVHVRANSTAVLTCQPTVGCVPDLSTPALRGLGLDIDRQFQEVSRQLHQAQP